MRIHKANVTAMIWAVAATVTAPTIAFVTVTHTRVAWNANVPSTISTTMNNQHHDKKSVKRAASKLFAQKESSKSSGTPSDDTAVNTAVSLKTHFAAVKQWTMAALVASTIWASPAAMAPYYMMQQNDNQDNTIITMGVATAKDKASGSGSRVNKDPESLLRYGLPIQNKEVSFDPKSCTACAFTRIL
jgi:uncharacterized paraquat-inducible protein A